MAFEEFSQDLSMLLGEVVQCVPVSFWATHKVKSYAAIVSRYGRDYNMVKRIGESPEVDRHETSYENETSLLEQENLAFSGRNVYRLPDAVTRAMGKQGLTHRLVQGLACSGAACRAQTGQPGTPVT